MSEEPFITIGLKPEVDRFFRTLETLIEHPRNSKPQDKHVAEFENIKKLYVIYKKEWAKTDKPTSFKFNVSKGFYDTWMWRTFDEALSTFHGLRKSEATELNDLYRSLNENKNHSLFLRNYNEYYDDL